MNSIELYIGIGILVVAGCAVQFVVSYRRHRRDHRQDLEPMLKSHGFTFISAKWPGLFKVGPFPKVEVEVGRPQSRFGGIRGEYDEYRVVTVKDSQGNRFEIWARLEFELFRLRHIRWRADKSRNASLQDISFLEN